MFCSECGTQAAGKFCWNCGHPLSGSTSTSTPTPNPKPKQEDWKEMIDYAALLQTQEVKDLLARQIPRVPLMTGEEFIGMFGKSISIPGKVIVDLYSRMGIQTGKVRSQHISEPCGKVLVALLCHLVQANLEIQTVQQASDACVLICKIPSDMLSWSGQLVVTVTKKGASTQVEAATKIGGQKYDWGKSKKILERLFQAAGKDITA